jgi:putative transposase
MIVARRGAQPLEHVIRDINKFTSLKIIDAINGNQRESRRELLMWPFERVGTRNPKYALSILATAWSSHWVKHE